MTELKFDVQTKWYSETIVINLIVIVKFKDEIAIHLEILFDGPILIKD